MGTSISKAGSQKSDSDCPPKTPSIEAKAFPLSSTTTLNDEEELPRYEKALVNDGHVWSCEDPPPRYSTCVPNSSRPSRRVAPLVPMDTLVLAAYHNVVQSHLHRLPDRILINIISRLDPSSMECLRRTARKFPPLCSDYAVGVPDTTPNAPMPWPRFRHDALVQSQLRDLLNKDRYCEDCQRTRHGPGWQGKVDLLINTYLHCAACRRDHPACLFSPKERHTRPEDRQCIGHEGFMRICSHTTGIVKWQQVESAPDSVEPLRGNQDTNIITCTHDSHQKPKCHSIWKASSGLGCEHASPQLDVPLYTNWIFQNWTAHVPITTQRNQPFTAQILRNRLADVRRNTAAQYVCPEGEPGNLLELRCFDPNLCDCVDFEGSESVDWQLTPIEKLDHNINDRSFWSSGACRGNNVYTKCLYPRICNNVWKHQSRLQRFEAKVHGYINTEARHSPYACHCSRHKIHSTGARLRHGHTTSEDYSVQEVTMRRCYDNMNEKKCLAVTYSRMFEIPWIRDPYTKTRVRSMGSAWYRALDPDSYNLTNDRDGLGVYWCKTEGCTNFYRYYLRRMLGVGDYYRSCQGSCPREDRA